MAWARSFLASRAHARERFASRFFARGAPVTKIGSRRGGRWLAGTAGAEGQFFWCRGELSSIGQIGICRALLQRPIWSRKEGYQKIRRRMMAARIMQPASRGKLAGLCLALLL